MKKIAILLTALSAVACTGYDPITDQTYQGDKWRSEQTEVASPSIWGRNQGLNEAAVQRRERRQGTAPAQHVSMVSENPPYVVSEVTESVEEEEPVRIYPERIDPTPIPYDETPIVPDVDEPEEYVSDGDTGLNDEEKARKRANEARVAAHEEARAQRRAELGLD